MSHGGGDGIDEGRLDLVPMIDCVMLLLLFFILTTKFTSEEKAISSLLPTDKGQMASARSKPVEEPKQINIVIYPEGMQKGYQPSEYEAQLKEIAPSGRIIANAYMRIGGDAMVMDGKLLSIKSGPNLENHIREIHALVAQGLAKFEIAGDRKDQVPVIVHCYSGMSWRFALIVYDAIRAYEASRATFKYSGKPEELNLMREVTFAPPRIRNYTTRELGNELFEIIHMK